MSAKIFFIVVYFLIDEVTNSDIYPDHNRTGKILKKDKNKAFLTANLKSISEGVNMNKQTVCKQSICIWTDRWTDRRTEQSIPIYLFNGDNTICKQYH